MVQRNQILRCRRRNKLVLLCSVLAWHSYWHIPDAHRLLNNECVLQTNSCQLGVIISPYTGWVFVGVQYPQVTHAGSEDTLMANIRLTLCTCCMHAEKYQDDQRLQLSSFNYWQAVSKSVSVAKTHCQCTRLCRALQGCSKRLLP